MQDEVDAALNLRAPLEDESAYWASMLDLRHTSLTGSQVLAALEMSMPAVPAVSEDEMLQSAAP